MELRNENPGRRYFILPKTIKGLSDLMTIQEETRTIALNAVERSRKNPN